MPRQIQYLSTPTNKIIFLRHLWLENNDNILLCSNKNMKNKQLFIKNASFLPKRQLCVTVNLSKSGFG